MKITANNIENVFKSKKISIETMELKGYKLIEKLFCDSSGLGAEDEPALTAEQLREKLLSIAREHGTIYTSIIECGQFQVYIGVFIKEGKGKAKLLKSNTYELFEGNKRIIRFYDTNILEFEGDKIRIFNGGFFTVTTRQRINEFLPQYISVYQRKFDWYIRNHETEEIIEFKEGIEVQK